MATEKRLVDAYALMNQVRESKRKNPHEDSNIARNHMYEHDHFTKLICISPTVDAVEVVHGEWNTVEDDYCGLVALECSVCNAQWWFEDDVSFGNYHYCPKCGAKMDGERKENGTD